MRRKTGCDSFESAPPRERVRPWYFNSRFKTENSKERFSMHHCLTKGLAILAASALTLFPMYQASAEDKDGSSTKTPIKHVVVIFQENVSFDHYFGTYPHAKENNDGSKYFRGAKDDTPRVNNLASAGLLTNNPNAANPFRIDRKNANTCDEDHSYGDEQFAFDGGLMDRFAKLSCKDPNIGSFSTMGYFWGFRFPTISLEPLSRTTPRPRQSSVHLSSSVQGVMVVTNLTNAFCFGVLLVSAAPVLAQVHGPPEQILADPVKAPETPILAEIRFTGLRRIAPAAVAAQIAAHRGDRIDPPVIEKDVRALARLGWFESIRVEATASTECAKQSPENSKCVALIFHVCEFPYLSKVEFSGSRLLSPKQIDKLLEDKKLAPGLGKPADPAALQRIAIAIRSALNELGHPEASVRIARKEASNATVAVRFEITDGPLLRVRRVNFDGHPHIPAKVLRAQMHNIASWKRLASWRDKNAYTREAFDEDRRRIVTYYQNHGFPEARVGSALVAQSNERSRHWLPWPHESAQEGLSISIPIEAGPYYRFGSMTLT